MQIRDRIKELRRVPASQLRPNVRNWRTHPENQRDALRGILAEVGYAGALLARELEDGSLELIDGHLRAETTPDSLVPVLVLDVNEAEAVKLLATFDPIAELAEANQEALGSLLKTVETDNDAVKQLLDKLATDLPAEGIDDQQLPDREFAAEVFQIVVECHGEDQQRQLYEELTGRGWKCRLLNL